MKNIKLTIEYDGTDFCGWQKQVGLRTVEGVLNNALSVVLNEEVSIIGSGRTDAKVHALGQVANFKSETQIALDRFSRAVNAYLPPDVAILSAEEVPMDFHSRYDPKRKTYLYRVQNGSVCRPVYRNYAYHYYRNLEEEKMRKALQMFIGEHDFKAFMSSGSKIKKTVRTIYKAKISRENDLLIMEVEGNGFLYNMVRRIVGIVLEAGSGSLEIGEIPKILEDKDNRRTMRLAPPQGLYLKTVKYID
ncbi:MAG: tRNA pseudouridine(38-40) synthase TruA [Peptostreptococcaceae bacterium]|nr:tRNA pseudouridine(38-40) synthase TruA [Peptostreptococcaceae bacterium]